MAGTKMRRFAKAVKGLKYTRHFEHKKIKKCLSFFRVHFIFLMWRAVCTLEKFWNFTVASSSTITHDSIFISSSCRRKSEKKNVLNICFLFQKRTKRCTFYCNTGVSQYIRAMMTWRVPPLRFFSLKRITPKERISLLVRNMSVNNTKKCKNGRAPRTVDSHATPV